MTIFEIWSNFFSVAECINCVWGIGNIVVSLWNFLTIRNKKKFLEELDKERKEAKVDNQRACNACKSAFEERIKDLKKINEGLLTKVK